MISFNRSIRKERANQPPFPSMFFNLLNFSFMDLFNCPGCIIRYFPGVKNKQTKLFQSRFLGLVFQVPEHSSVLKKQLQTKQTSFQKWLATGDPPYLHDLNSPSGPSLCISQALPSLLLCVLLSRPLSSIGFSSICCFSRMSFNIQTESKPLLLAHSIQYS